MGVTNLGRVQGGSVFYTTTQSGTSIANSTITPTNIVPLLGDSVLFPNGDIRKITAVADSVVTCGEVSTNIKGVQGEKGDTGAGSNPNLLINGDFRVNQRGLPTYTVTNLYTVDRWRSSTSNLTINVETTGISISGGARTRFLYQIIEDYKSLIGKTVTFSIKIKGIAGYSCKLNFYDVVSNETLTEKIVAYTGDYQIVSYTATIPSDWESLAVLIYGNTIDTALSDKVFVEWAKLEIGSVATAYSPRPYAEELALCQRYYQVLDGASLGMWSPRTQYQIRNVIQFKVEMRTAPTMSQISPVSLYDLTATTAHIQSQIDLQTSSFATTKSAMIALTSFQDLTLGHIGYITTSSNIITLDAEIY